MTFQIVREISAGQKRVNGRKVDTIQAIVRFPDGDATRHIEHHPIIDDKGKVVGWHWTGWNSDRVLREREGILATHDNHKALVSTSQERVSKIGGEIAELKNKRGVTEKRKALRADLKAAKAAFAVASSDLARVKVYADAIEHDGAFPEIVAFE